MKIIRTRAHLILAKREAAVIFLSLVCFLRGYDHPADAGNRLSAVVSDLPEKSAGLD